MAKSMAWDASQPNTLVVGTNKGMLWQLNTLSGEWSTLLCDQRFSFCCVKLNVKLPGGRLALLVGTGTGQLMMISNEAAWEPVVLKAHNIPILDVFICQYEGGTVVFSASGDGELHW